MLSPDKNLSKLDLDQRTIFILGYNDKTYQ